MEFNDPVRILSNQTLGIHQLGRVVDFSGPMTMVHFDSDGTMGIYYKEELLVIETTDYDEWLRRVSMTTQGDSNEYSDDR